MVDKPKKSGKKRVIVAVVLGLVAVGTVGVLVSGALAPPSISELDFEVRMIPSQVPRDVLCLNTETKGKHALEIIHPLKAMVAVQGGERQLAQEDWADFSPAVPWKKNQDIQNLYESHCHYRSPGAASDCDGWDCARYEEVSGYTWRKLGAFVAMGCYPTGSDGCESTNATPGHLAVILIEKCHVIRVKSPTMELTDPAGNKFVMNAHAAAEPTTEVDLPAGWRVDIVERSEPLQVVPFGGGDECFHVVLNDSKKQFYHQFVDADGVFP